MHMAKQESLPETGSSELERAMAATLKNLESIAPTTSEIKPEDEKRPTMTEDYEAELKKRQADKFRELLRDKVSFLFCFDNKLLLECRRTNHFHINLGAISEVYTT